MERSRTVPEAKTAFLRQQIRLLSAILQPSSSWRDSAPPLPTEASSLSDKAVEEAVGKVNAKIKQHNRMVYSDEATRHVAEQIDILYWGAVSKAAGDGEAEDRVAVEKGADLMGDEMISTLPESLVDISLSEDPTSHYTEEDLEGYATAHANLVSLAARRTAAQNRLAQLQSLRKLLVPYQNPQTNIQPNLVTRNGELGKELDRMRILLARVTGAIQQQGRGRANGDESGGLEDGEGLSGATVTEMDVGQVRGNQRSEQEKLNEVLMDLS